MTGVHDDDPEPCPRVYDPVRRTWSDAWKDHLTEMELKEIASDTPRMMSRVSEHVKEPKNLLEIAEYGIENPDYATCAIAEIMDQLYNQDDSNLLVAIDGYSDWFRNTEYTSFRYANSGFFIPPHDLALPRIFIKFDGHMIKNGFKICTSTQEAYHGSIFTPNLIDSPKGFDAEVQGLHLNEFRNAVRYFYMIGRALQEVSETRIESIHMESQGNWKGLFEHFYCSIEYNQRI